MKRLFLQLATAVLFFSCLSCKKENTENRKTLTSSMTNTKTVKLAFVNTMTRPFIVLYITHTMLAQVYSTKTEIF